MSSDLILVPLHNAVRSKMLDVQKTMTACDTVRGAGKITHALLVDGWTARSRASTPARAFPPATFPRGDGLVGCGGGRASLNCAAPGLQRQEAELRRFKDVVAELTAENLELKKGLSG